MGQEHTTTKQNETITGEYDKKTRTLYHHRITTNFQKIDNTGKRTIDLTFVRSLKNVKVSTKDFNIIKTGQLATKFL